MAFCIPKEIAKILQEAARRGEIDIHELYDMDSAQRRAFFEQYTNEINAKGINAGFENAILSQKQTALRTWAKNTFSIKEKARQKNVIDKINELSELGVLTPDAENNFLQDLVAEKLGVTISESEARQINKLATDLKTEFEKPTDKFGLPSDQYFRNRREMDKYLQSLTPSPKLRVATSTIGRGALLLNLKSSMTNIIGNTVQAVGQSLERRISSGRYTGAVDPKIIGEYFKRANKIFQASNYDITRLQSYSEGVRTLGEKITHAQGKGVVRRIGRFYEDVVFKQLLGTPDVAFSAAHFGDSANLASTKLATSENLTGDKLKTRATSLFLDATAINPTTLEGEVIRQQSIADSLVATFQDNSRYSSLALGIRKMFNTVTGDVRVGDQIMPFVKTPANVIGMSLDAGGLGAARGLVQLPHAIKEMKLGNPKPMQNATRAMVRTGLGMTAAFMLAAFIKPKDFVGKYPTTTKEKELLKSKNARANSIRIGNKWLSLDYFGFLGAPLVGFLYANKYGDTLPEKIYSYASGVVIQAKNVPGFEALRDVTERLSRLDPRRGKTIDEVKREAITSAVDFIRSRSIPGIVYDIAKAFDASEREVDWKDPLQRVRSTIPGIRNTLPEKVDVFGDVIQGEPWYSTILFGARVKTARDSRLIDEMKRLDETGNLPSLTRPEKTSSRFKSLKEQIDDKEFDKAMRYFREKYKENTLKLMDSKKYEGLGNEEKKKEIDKIKQKWMDRTLKRFKYDKKKDKSSNELIKNNVIADMFSKANSLIVKEAFAAEEFRNHVPFMEGSDDIKDRSIIQKVTDFIRSLFEKKVISPLPDDVVKGGKTPYKVSKTETGLIKVENIMGVAFFEEEEDAKKYLAGIQGSYKEMTGEKYPEELPNWQVEEKKKIPKVPIKSDKKSINNYGRNPSYEKTKPSNSVNNAINKAAEVFGVPSSLLFDVALQESSLSPNKVNTTEEGRQAGNPTGLFQFTDGTWKTVLAFNNDKESSLYKKLPTINRKDPKTNALAAAYLIKHGQLGKWDASENIWGEFWTPEELESLGFYDQSIFHIKGIRPSIRLASK